MPFELEQVVPWGRSMSEYIDMFALSAADQQRRVLGCGDGPASFNGEWRQQGGSVLSVDPVYRFSASAIANRIEHTRATVMQQINANKDDFIWKRFADPEALCRARLSTMQKFLSDFEHHPQHYLAAALPNLGLSDQSFDLALCSHFLFLYSDALSSEFHCQAVLELCRVAREVRIFPLLALDLEPSRHLAAVLEVLKQKGFNTAIETVSYEFQRGANQMLTISRR